MRFFHSKTHFITLKLAHYFSKPFAMNLILQSTLNSLTYPYLSWVLQHNTELIQHPQHEWDINSSISNYLLHFTCWHNRLAPFLYGCPVDWHTAVPYSQGTPQALYLRRISSWWAKCQCSHAGAASTGTNAVSSSTTTSQLHTWSLHSGENNC